MRGSSQLSAITAHTARAGLSALTEIGNLPITPMPITPYHCYRSLSTPHRHLYAGTAAVGAADTLPKDAYVKRGAGAASPRVSAGDAHTAALVARVCGPGRLPGDAWGPNQ